MIASFSQFKLALQYQKKILSKHFHSLENTRTEEQRKNIEQKIVFVKAAIEALEFYIDYYER